MLLLLAGIVAEGGCTWWQNTALSRRVQPLEKARTRLSSGLSLEEKGGQGDVKSRASQKELATNQIPNSLRLTWVFHSKALPRCQTVTQYLKAACAGPCIPGESQAGAGGWSKGLWGLRGTPPQGRCWGVSKRVVKGRERSFSKSLCTFPSLPFLLPKHAPVQWVTGGCRRPGIPAVPFSTRTQSSLTTQTRKTRPGDRDTREHRTILAVLQVQQTTDKILARRVQRRVFLKTGAGRKGESIAHF